MTQIAGTEAASAARWPELPPLTTVNPIRAVKPGATVLLSGADGRRRDHVVLASQRYGRGKSIAQPVQDSWLWQMHAKMTLEDQTHENYWRQMLRWLVDGVPDTVDVHTVADRVQPGEPVTLVADVVDRAFVELNDARVLARVRRPNGAVDTVPMQWTGEQNGEYRATFATAEQGLYTAEVEAGRGTTAVGRSVTHVRVVPSDAEYFDASMQAARLRRIAEDTGGRFYTASKVAGLPEDLQYTGRGVTTIEERELWHMPIVLIALLGIDVRGVGFTPAGGACVRQMFTTEAQRSREFSWLENAFPLKSVSVASVLCGCYRLFLLCLRLRARAEHARCRHRRAGRGTGAQ